MLYMVLLGITLLVNSALPQLYGPTKLVQLVLVCGLCWHWRKLVPELTWKFHWSVVPVSIVLCALWVMMRNGVKITLTQIKGILKLWDWFCIPVPAEGAILNYI